MNRCSHAAKFNSALSALTLPVTNVFVAVALLACMVSSMAGQAVPDSAAQTRAYYAGEFPNGAAVYLGTDFTEIQVLKALPPGNYIANASAVLAASSPQFRLVDCYITVSGIRRGELSRGQIGGDLNNFLTLSLGVGFHLSSTSDVGIACRADVPDQVLSQPSPLTAIRVGRLVIQHQTTE